jgi:surfactin synthase thioesterase subunit
MVIAERWIRPLRPRPDAAARVVLFAHAGGRPGLYHRVVGPLPPEVEVLGVTLPGREERAAEPPATTVAEVVRGVGAELERLPSRPTVLFGHSLGAMLATAVSAGRPGIARALVLSAGMPGAHAYGPDSWLTTDRARAELFRYHGVDDDALAVDSPLPPARRVLAHDLVLAHEAMSAIVGCRVDVPISALGGTDDALVPAGTLWHWATFTGAGFRRTLVEGGHFFPFLPAGRRALVTEIVRRLEEPASRSAA